MLGLQKVSGSTLCCKPCTQPCTFTSANSEKSPKCWDKKILPVFFQTGFVFFQTPFAFSSAGHVYRQMQGWVLGLQ